MKNAIQWILSVIFLVIAYGLMAVYALVFAPWALVHRNGAFAAAHAWCKTVRFLARWIVGLKTEIRGTPPSDEVLVVGKHQSFLDIILIYSAVPRGKFIMKKELLWTPIVGQYAVGMGCVAVDRGKRGLAIKKMVADVASGRKEPGQLIIFPQGTRVPPGEARPYKIGSGVLYKEMGQDCVPVACNVGLFWPGHGIMRRRGTAVIEFLPRIEPGKRIGDFMKELEDAIETRSNALMAEAGFEVTE